MSVLVVVKVSGDTDTFQKALADRADEFVAVKDRAVAQGAMHHRFGIGEGHVVAIDEWETAEAFEQFFADPRMHEFIASIGADPAPPEITITEAIPSPDEF
jgi:quinol monooxygenase YgiN